MKESTRALDAVSQLFPSRQLRFFLTAPAPCPYLAGKFERKVFAHLPLSEGATVNDALTLGGFRRSQNIAYRPACDACDACVSARIPAAPYVFSRSERRILASGIQPVWVTAGGPPRLTGPQRAGGPRTGRASIVYRCSAQRQTPDIERPFRRSTIPRSVPCPSPSPAPSPPTT